MLNYLTENYEAKNESIELTVQHLYAGLDRISENCLDKLNNVLSSLATSTKINLLNKHISG